MKAHQKQALQQYNEMKGDIERHVQVAREAQQNYEREVMAHSGSLQSLTKAKEDLISLRNQLAESEVLTLFSHGDQRLTNRLAKMHCFCSKP